MHRLAVSLLLLLILPCVACAEIYVVCPDGTGDFPNIQAAINAAHDGDVIVLTEGTFSGPGNNEILFQGKAITVTSEIRGKSTVDYGGSEYAFSFDNGEGPDCILDGVVITNHHSADGHMAIFCRNATPSISWCTLRECTSFFGAISVGEDGWPTVANCTLYENQVGFFLFDAIGVTLQSVIISFGGSSVQCHSGCDLVTELHCCDIYGNEGDYVGVFEGLDGVFGNISEDPLFCGASYPEEPLRLQSGSPCGPHSPPNEECDLIGAWPVGCDPAGANPPPTGQIGFYLTPNGPNPFSAETRMTFVIPDEAGDSHVRLSVYDAAGRLIRTLVDRRQGAGIHRISWDGRTHLGKPATSGVYSCRLRVADRTISHRMVLVH
jgi:hypothetical protein